VPECGALPVPGAELLSPYGAQRSGRAPHYGLDLRAPEGARVQAVRAGLVRVVAPNGQIDRYGVTVVIDHGPWYSLSSHLLEASVRPGERVRWGQQIGRVGRTAGTAADPHATFDSAPAHLHLEFLDRWPVVGGGAGRLDASAMCAELGVIVPPRGPIASVCAGSQPAERPVIELGARPRPRGSTAAALALVLVLYALSRAG
jgi:murein DD-endopeptidase MepM/ murein hydrolase activator NlpD